ncbi:MAG: sulfatase-like hydrolase/transferase [Candidatus Parcubacteria bacterium]|nr:sulfatase-like hydrolase/transferase [Candidatus Parcubacteria bacterium]
MAKIKPRILQFGIIFALATIIITLLVLIPSFYLVKITNLKELNILVSVVKQLSILIIFILPLLFLSKSKLLIIALSLLSTAYYSLIFFLVYYWSTLKTLFNPYFFVDSYDAIIPTANILFGPTVVIFSAIALTIFVIFLFYFFYVLYTNICELKKHFSSINKQLKYLLIIPVAVLCICPQPFGFITYHYHLIKEVNAARHFFRAYIPDYKNIKTNSNENIFILQLESINAMATQGQAANLDAYANQVFIPNFQKIAKDGIFFPYFWSNSIQTIRAQENILCGITNNIDEGIAYDDGVDMENCLPNILKKSGYKTIVFRSDNLEFQGMGDFFQKLGYEEVHYTDIMKPQDPKYQWGFDDCIFYQRAFEYLKNKGLDKEKIFVYFEVSSTHLPWEPKAEYTFTHKFNSPANYLEKYLNSQSEQDYCLGKFYEEYKEYNDSKSHLFILSDHSWPIGFKEGNYYNFQNAFNENYLTVLSYFPPTDKTGQFNIGKTVKTPLIYSETDIPPTIFELLNNQSYQNSFVFELKKESTQSTYENCQILTQPYSGGYLIIISGTNKYIYSVIDKTVTQYDLINDLYEQSPKIIETNLPFEAFKEKYFCQRYK